MYEVLLIILVSILFTSFAFIFSHVMVKYFGISHPKNRFWIYTFALLTAFSIFSISFVTMGDIVDNSEKEFCSVVMIVGESDVTNQDFSPIDSRYYFRSSEDQYSSNVTNLFFSQENKMITVFSQFTNNPKDLFSKIFPSYYSNPSFDSNSAVPLVEDVDTSSVLVNDNDSVGIINESLSFFIMINLLLLLISFLFLLFSLFFGKRFILKKYNAKLCEDYELLHLIREMSRELKIKMVKVFIYNGPPNAFVFGFPTSLAISKNLIDCLSKKELGIAIRHELAHIKNNDLIVKPVLQCLRILFFYNPIVHLIYYKLIRERELMADSLFINSKDEKIALIEALVKIYEFSKRRGIISRNISGSFSLSLLSHSFHKLDIGDRFNHLFSKKVKKTFFSVMICFVILILNVSMVAVAKNVLDTSNHLYNEDFIENDDLCLDKNNVCSHPVKYINSVFQGDHSSLCRRYVIYFVVFDLQNGDMSSKDLVDSMKCLLMD